MPSIFSQIRNLRAGKPVARSEETPTFDLPAVRAAIDKDQALSTVQKKELLTWLSNPEIVSELRNGTVGAALSLVLTRFLNLKPKTQLLLSIAGFGLGKLLYDFKNDPKNSSRWNPRLRMYELTNE